MSDTPTATAAPRTKWQVAEPPTMTADHVRLFDYMATVFESVTSDQAKRMEEIAAFLYVASTNPSDLVSGKRDTLDTETHRAVPIELATEITNLLYHLEGNAHIGEGARQRIGELAAALTETRGKRGTFDTETEVKVSREELSYWSVTLNGTPTVESAPAVYAGLLASIRRWLAPIPDETTGEETMTDVICQHGIVKPHCDECRRSLADLRGETAAPRCGFPPMAMDCAPCTREKGHSGPCAHPMRDWKDVLAGLREDLADALVEASEDERHTLIQNCIERLDDLRAAPLSTPEAPAPDSPEGIRMRVEAGIREAARRAPAPATPSEEMPDLEAIRRRYEAATSVVTYYRMLDCMPDIPALLSAISRIEADLASWKGSYAVLDRWYGEAMKEIASSRTEP